MISHFSETFPFSPPGDRTIKETVSKDFGIWLKNSSLPLDLDITMMLQLLRAKETMTESRKSTKQNHYQIQTPSYTIR